VLRVVGVAAGRSYWMLRISCTTDGALRVGTALARRPDTSWVHLLSGGTELSSGLQTWSDDERQSLLLDKLTRTPQVESVTADPVLRIFRGGQASWNALATLTDDQAARLRPDAVETVVPGKAGPRDRPLLTALAQDGRASYTELAAATGWSETSIRRRVGELRSTGALYFDVDVAPRALGFTVAARLWLSVAPSALATVGQQVAEHPEVVFAGATAGTSNLLAVVVCKDAAALSDYLTDRLATVKAIRAVESAPILRTLKGLA
jgi:DNA-binding Lrp family transcriptional regulator